MRIGGGKKSKRIRLEVIAVIQASHDGGTNRRKEHCMLKSGQVLFKGGPNRISLAIACGTIAKEETRITPF